MSWTIISEGHTEYPSPPFSLLFSLCIVLSRFLGASKCWCQLTLPRQAAAVVGCVCCCWVGCVLVSNRLQWGGEKRLPRLFLQLLYSQPSFLFRIFFFSFPLKLSFFLQKSRSAGRRSLRAFWGLSSPCVPPRELLAIVSWIHSSAHFHLHPK